MKPAPYRLDRPGTLAATAQALLDGGWACKPVAGGQSLGAMLNLRLAQPDTLVDLDGIDSLRPTHDAGTHVDFGAMTTHAEIEDARVPDPSLGLMPFVARGIAYRAVRNRGTLGGSLCHADPAADWVAAMPLLDATLLVAGADGAREIPAADFMVSAFETRLADGELLTAIRVPRLSPGVRWSYRKFCRKTGEFAQALAAATFDPANGMERVVLGALDGAPRVFSEKGLLSSLVDATRRQAFLRAAKLSLTDARMALLDEMLRLVAADLKVRT